MLSQYFGFQEEPFGATPDPRWLYRSAKHREALASLRYGFYSNRGFTALIAPPGLGKTTLLYQFLHDIRNSARIVFLFDTQCETLGLLRYILRALGIAPAANGDEMHAQLEEVLVQEYRAGRRVLVVVDEAQNLSDEALEMLRLLTNYETPQAKLLHIILSGQPLLADTLMKPSMEQLRQRVSTTACLEPFSMDETTAYIRHRLEQAGYRGAPLFRKDALRRIMAASHGVPRIINNLCFNALSLCIEQERQQVDGGLAAEAIAIQELDPAARKKITDRWEATAGQSLEPEPSPRSEDWIQREEPIQARQPTRLEERLQHEKPLQIEQPIEAEQPVPSPPAPLPEQQLQAEKLLQPVEPLQAEPLQFEQSLQSEQRTQTEAPIASAQPRVPEKLIQPVQPLQQEQELRFEQLLRSEQLLRFVRPVEHEKLLRTERQLRFEQLLRSEPRTQTEPPLPSAQPPLPEKQLQPEQLLQPVQPLQPEQRLQTEPPLELLPEPLLRLGQPAEDEEPKSALRKLLVPAAAVLLMASGIGMFSLFAGWQPWSRLTGYLEPFDTKVQSASRPQPSEPDTSTPDTDAPSSKPSPLNTNDLTASTPAPGAVSADEESDPTAKTKPSPARVLVSAPVPADGSRITVAVPAAKTTPLASKVVSSPVSAPALSSRGRVTATKSPAETSTMSAMVIPPANPALSATNINRAAVAEPPTKARPFQITAEPNQTLHDICVRYLGIWDLKRLHEIQALNPELTDLDHIQAGQKIWLPAPEPAPIAQPSPAQAHPNQTAGAGTNAGVRASATTASARNPAGGNLGAAESPYDARRVANASLPSVTGGSGAGHYGKVAPAGIPRPSKGTALANMHVAPVPAEMIPKPASNNPAEQDTPNCGGAVEVPCPKLKIRPTSPPD